MKTNMAFSLVMGGGALLLLDLGSATVSRRVAATAMSALVLVVGALTLSEHLFRVDLGIDQLLATEPPGAAATTSPNRFGLPGSISLTLLGAGLLALAARRRVAVHFGVVTAFLVLVPAVGYVYAITPFYSTVGLTGIAWPTVLALLSLAIGVTVAAPGGLSLLWRDNPGGELVRRLLPAAVLIPLVLGYFRVQGERHGLYGAPAGSGLFALTLVLLLAGLLWRNGRQSARRRPSANEPWNRRSPRRNASR